jgi:hypothetical protein
MKKILYFGILVLDIHGDVNVAIFQSGEKRNNFLISGLTKNSHLKSKTE